ncbi:MAG: hypothetical protein ACD_62C00026G0004 [uncultured bacterium]|nr:MAG: hypothetical protein ACD_62C00026G0004 [uncultured bacterium]
MASLARGTCKALSCMNQNTPRSSSTTLYGTVCGSSVLIDKSCGINGFGLGNTKLVSVVVLCHDALCASSNAVSLYSAP